MGDSVLDNFYWLKEKKNHLRVELEKTLLTQREGKGSYQVINLAMDETSTFDFLDRDPESHPWNRYSQERGRVFTKSEELDYSYLREKDGHYRPLALLQQIHNVKHIILSLGGNDVYLYPNIQWDLITSLLPRYRRTREEVAEKFAQRYKVIIQNIRYVCPQTPLTLIIPYHPHYSFNLFGLRRGCGHRLVNFMQYISLSSLVTPLVQQILRIAKNYQVDVIDLSKTFDINCELHYGTGNKLDKKWSGAEPSNLSNVYIAQLCGAIVKKQEEEEREHEKFPIYMYGVAGDFSLLRLKYKILTDFPISHYKFGPFSVF